MILLGHKFIESEFLYQVYKIKEIVKTPPSSTLLVEFKEENLNLIKYINDNLIPIAIDVKNIQEMIYAEALNAKYILINQDILINAISIATNYLYDAKILVHVKEDKNIEKLALNGIDGIIYKQAIKKI